MKYLIFFFLLFNFLILDAQTKDQPFKNANTILIETLLSGKDAFVSWGKHLGQNGFSIDKSDANFFTLTTGTKDTERFGDEYYLICAVSDSGTIKIKIKWRKPPFEIINFKGTEYFDWEYSPSKGNVNNSIFVSVSKLINSFGSYAIKYLKE